MNEGRTVRRMLLRDSLGAWHTTRLVDVDHGSVCDGCSFLCRGWEGKSGVVHLCNYVAGTREHFEKLGAGDVLEILDDFQERADHVEEARRLALDAFMRSRKKEAEARIPSFHPLPGSDTGFPGRSMDPENLGNVVLFKDGVPFISDKVKASCLGCPFKGECRLDLSVTRAFCTDLMGPDDGTFRAMSYRDVAGILEEVKA